jgi:hypothetical protein
MKSPPSPLLISHGMNGHRYRFEADDHTPLVFDRLDTYWAGAPLPAHDFSRYALGIGRRLTNFLPVAPHGLVTIIPDDTDLAGHPRFKRKFSTNGQSFFDAQGKKHGAVAHAPVVAQAIQEAAKDLPVRVQGEVHWSVTRLDTNHVRVVLIDPGYVDPADRDAQIVLQHLAGQTCKDILSGETLPIVDMRIRVKVPAGILRVLDIRHD